MASSDRDQAGDIVTLAALKFDKDPRTIEEMVAEDEFEDVTVEKAERDGERTTISWDGGTTTSVKGPKVKVGDTVRFYGSARLGGSHHGWALNGELVEWKTPWERFAKRVRWLADYDRRKREDFAERRDDLDRRVAELPGPLRQRIERFRAESPSFRVDSEAYEMAAVGDAPKIAKAIASAQGWKLTEDLCASGIGEEQIEDAVRTFSDLPYAEQKAMVPDLDEGHSGNTFGGAVHLAFALLVGKEV